jgi:hypothetical protein
MTMPAGDATVTATYQDEATPVEYLLTVNSGSGSGSYSVGAIVNLVADAPPSGQVFDQWTGDTATVADVIAASTSMTMPAGNVTVTATYEAGSVGGTYSFSPTDDAYLQGGTRFNDAYLKVEAGYRVSYLKFSVSGLSGSVQRATLRLQENGDLGSGTLRVYRGSHNNWTETTLTGANAPLENGQVGLLGGAVGSGQVVSVDVSSWITGNGTYTAIVKLDAGGNDVWFGSEESARKPQLIVETGGGGSPSYQLTVNSGSGSGSYTAGAVVDLVADAPPVGQVFDQWTGDMATVVDVNSASTSMTMPAGNATVTATYEAVSSGGTFSFGPTDDAYLQGSTRFNDAYLKVEAGYRVAYLKFSVSGLSGSVQQATLRLQENGDPGSGTLRVYRGSHNNWTETTLTGANAPLENDQVGLYEGAVGSGQVVSVDVSSWITGNGTYTAIVKLDAGGNDVWFGSEESARKPQLIIETGGSGSPSYQLTVNSGSGSGSYTAGAVVDLVADAPPVGQVFDQWTGDTATVADVNAASTSMTMPAGNATVTATYEAVSSGGTFSFGPTDDAYLQGSTRFNDAYLKVEAGYRVAYLKFNVSGLSGSVQQATLRLQENGDLGSGTLRVHRGSHNNWTETTLTGANAPLENGQVGLYGGTVGSGQVVSVEVSSWITGNGVYTAIIKLDAGGNDVWFGSDESSRKPQLIVETGDSGASPFALNSRAVTVLPKPLRIRWAWLSSTELELAWELVDEADDEIQVRASASEGPWTTIHRAAGSSGGTVTLPMVISSTNTFFRVVRDHRSRGESLDTVLPR